MKLPHFEYKEAFRISPENIQTGGERRRENEAKSMIYTDIEGMKTIHRSIPEIPIADSNSKVIQLDAVAIQNA